MDFITRKNEIAKHLTAMSEEKYEKNEVLGESLTLQKQMVNATFEEQHGKFLKLQDIIKHFSTYEFKNGDELKEVKERFKNSANSLISKIIVEMAGKVGEEETYNALKTKYKDEYILRNIGLYDDGMQSEIDNVVLTKNGIFLIETKHTNFNILIDDEGNYIKEYDNGDSYLVDNIGEKFNKRLALFKKMVSKSPLGEKIIKSNIQELLVFVINKGNKASLNNKTNKIIAIKNKYKYIRHCELATLPHIIEEYVSDVEFTDEELMEIRKFIIDNKYISKDKPVDFNVSEFKDDFATLLTSIEFEQKEIAENKRKNDEDVTMSEEEISKYIKENKADIDLLDYAIPFAIGGAIGAAAGYVAAKVFKI